MPARRSDWKTEAMARTRPVDYSREASREQVTRLREGRIPEAMEDKWFSFLEDERLHLHRSWRGNEFFSADLQAQADGTAHIVNVLVNDDECHFITESWMEPSELFERLLDYLMAEP